MASEQDYLAAVDQFLAVYNHWASDTEAPQQPSLEFETSITKMFTVCCYSDVPNRCRNLNRYVEPLFDRWQEYAGGQSDAHGNPPAAFWKAINDVVSARQQARQVQPKRREPVKMLIEQKVTYEQIACHIYGYRGHGPLMTDGRPDLDKIAQEAASPGSVIPFGWVHPEDKALMEGIDAPLPRRRTMEAPQEKRAWSNEQVAAYLKEGATNIEQVVNVSGRTVEEIELIANGHGVKLSHIENLGSVRSAHEPTYDQDATTMLSETAGGISGPAASAGAGDTGDGDDEGVDVEQVYTEEDIAGLVKTMHESRPELGSADIAREISNTTGHALSMQKVSSILRKPKATAAASAS